MKSWLARFLVLIFALGLIEGGSYLTLKLLQPAVSTETSELQDAIQRTVSGRLAIPHPYLGFVYDSQQKFLHAGIPISRFGFIDDKDPILKRADDQVIIGIFGGSVAWWLSKLGEEQLREALSQSPELAGKKIIFLRLALGAYKQPQQMLELSYLLTRGAEFDVIINLDGYNEVAVPRLEHAFDPLYPYLWPELMANTLNPDAIRIIGRIELLRMLEAQTDKLITNFPWSSTAQLVAQLSQKLLHSKRASYSAALKSAIGQSALLPVAKGVGQSYATHEELYQALADVWMRSSETMANLCRQHQIRYLHFLQPNQYVPNSKIMSDEERAVAISPRHEDSDPVIRAYPILQSRGATLRERGVEFIDLTGVFSATAEATYVDNCCHLTQLGNQILARAIARQIVRPAQ